jgi:hypothetical protein
MARGVWHGMAVPVGRVHPRDIGDELAVADDTGKVAGIRYLEVDVARFQLIARMPAADRRLRGDAALVGGGCDTREVSHETL